MKSLHYLLLIFCLGLGQLALAQCSLDLTLVTTIPAKCYGTPTGGLQSSIVGATPPVSYLLDGQIPSAQPNILNAIPSGLHYFVATDGAGCVDTIFFTITQPPQINITTNHTDASCNGGSDGTAMASATGGNGGFTYEWQGCLGGNVLSGASISNLSAGCYKVYVEDSNDCENTATVQIDEPAPFIVMEDRDSVSCFNGTDGAIGLSVAGGIAPYTYLWDNGQTTPRATNLASGYHPVTISDSDGCSTVYLAEAFQPLRLNIDNVIRTPPLCSAGLDGTAEAIVTGGTLPYTFNWSGGTNMGNSSTGLGSGSYTVSVTDAHGCTDSQTFNLVSQQQITIFTTAKSNESCFGACDGSATLSISGGAAPYSYQWADPSLPQPDPMALCAGNYTITVTDQNGCSKTHALTINPGNQLDVTFLPTNPTCFDRQDGRIISNVSGAILPINYTWSNAATSTNLMNLACGSYSLTVTDGSGCSGVQTTDLACPPAIHIDSISAILPKCTTSANGSLTAHVQGGQGNLSYLWSDMNQQTLATAINLIANTYTITVTDANQCTSSATKELLAPSPINVAISATDILCVGDNTGSATLTASGGTGLLTYTWNVPGSSNSLGNLPVGTYYATVTDANACTALTNTVTVNGPSNPLTLSTNQSKIACFAIANARAEVIPMGGTGPIYTYAWSTGDNTASVSDLSAGTITVTVTDQNNCSQTEMVLIEEYAPIEGNVAFSKPSCFGLMDGSAAVNNVDGGAGNGTMSNYNYAWSAPNTGNTDFIDQLNGGTYTLTITDSEACSTILMFQVEQPAEIKAEFALLSPSCFGENTGTLDLIQTFGDNPIQTYAWNTGASTPSLSEISAGTYALTLTDTDNCSKDTSFVLTEPSILSITNFEISGIKCANDSLGSITPTVEGGTWPYSFSWSSGSLDSLLRNQKAGFYTLFVADSHGCLTADSVVLSNPVGLDFSLITEPVACYGDHNGRIEVQTQGGTPPFRYSLDGENFSGSSVFIALPAGNQSVIVQDGNGCLSENTTTIEEPLPIEVFLEDTIKIHLGDSILIDAQITNGQGVLIYNWFAANNKDFYCQDASICDKILSKARQDNKYTLVVEDENGCRGEDQVVILVEKSRGIFVPTGFTPNGDNMNEMLCIYGKKRDVKTVHMFRIFDRWGTLVYEDTDVPVNTENRGWDGTFRGKNTPSGNYIWYVDVEYLDGFRETVKGQTELIR